MGKRVLGVIPARMHSTRLPAKMLRLIGGKPLIQHVWERCRAAKQIDRLIIATDHEDIVKAVKGFKGDVLLTDPAHTSGTDRVAEVAAKIDCDVVINIQGDEPFISAGAIDALAVAFDKDPALEVATLCYRVKDMRLLCDPNCVKVVRDNRQFALYFSRAPIPFDREKGADKDFLKHIGIYAFAKAFLMRFSTLPPSELEQRERLEQLRILSNGGKIKVIETEYDSCGVDTEDDLNRAEQRYRTLQR